MIYSETYWQEQIHRIMPDIEIREVDLFHEGLVNDVLIVNRKWVIRFTKTDYGKEMMALEARLMRFPESNDLHEPAKSCKARRWHVGL